MEKRGGVYTRHFGTKLAVVNLRTAIGKEGGLEKRTPGQSQNALGIRLYFGV